jgi:hypothetical protein
MSTNPFDDENGIFYALINNEGQYSLWPTYRPAGRSCMVPRLDAPASITSKNIGGTCDRRP